MPSTAPENAPAGLDEDLAPLADETTDKARRVVASYSSDAEECRMLLDMLGIGPEAPAVDAD